MVARSKDLSLNQILDVRKRTLSLAGLGRIKETDADYIVERCNEIITRIREMVEFPQMEEERTPF